MLSAKQIRAGFIDFFKDRSHEVVPSSPVVPVGDDSLLFANAGMNQFKDIFLGLTGSSYARVVNSQKCIRVSGKHNDLEEVGVDTYHHTFFEMLGNWSFNDYFKAEAIEWAWQLLTEVWGIDPDKLWATVFSGSEKEGLAPDEEAAELWTRLTPIPAGRVLYFGKKDNFWEMGEVGPCGPCSEIHIDLGPDRCDKKDQPGHKCSVNGGCGRFIELWNLVFIQHNRLQSGRLEPLGAKYIDTGAGLERIAAVLQNVGSNYDTDLFRPIIAATEQITGHKYNSRSGNEKDNAFRVISDHIRSLVFAITDGATPSNEARGYVIRRILRRACRFGRILGMHEPFMFKLVPAMVDIMGQAFGEIKDRADFVADVIEAEETSFGRTLDRGIEIFTNAAKRAENEKDKTITGDDAFMLYDTYGFPLDLTELMARERNLKVDTEGFAKLMDKQRQRARAAQKEASLGSVLVGVELPTTDDALKYQTDVCDSQLVGWITQDGFCQKGSFADTKKDVGLVLKETCFYAESGGQVGDSGTISGPGWQFDVINTTKIAECVVHQGNLKNGKITAGDTAKAEVNKNRTACKKNHTATHLLQWALQQVLGESVRQQGSLVCADYLRFDFTYPKALTEDEKKRVEELVRGKIAANVPVISPVMPIAQAKKLGAMALFGEKYGSQVRLVAIGAADKSEINGAFSKEFCGGTHCANTGQIGGFKITKEESISAGVRRITALTGEKLTEFMEKRSEIIDKLSQLLKTSAESLEEKVQRLVDENKKLAKDLKAAASRKTPDVMAQARELLENSEKTGPTSLITGRLSTTSVEQARSAIDMLKKKAKSAAVVIGIVDNDKVTLLAGMTDDLVKAGLSAGQVVKAVAPIIDGGGGGRANMAQAGGKNPENLNQALKKAAEIIKQKLIAQ